MKEAAARIKINKLLENSGWRFFADERGPANIQLEAHVTIRPDDLDSLGENFEKTASGFVDFLLLDAKGFPLVVLEAKPEDRNPLTGKEQARKYARSQYCRFVILSNGNLHYFWDLERGNPYLVTSFPAPDSISAYQKVTPDPQRLVDEPIDRDYLVLTQRPGYHAEAWWKNEADRPAFVKANKLRFLWPYQLKAVHALQRAVKEGGDRFLFEMATGTGKTVTAAAVIKLFLRTGNARRVLFLVDRLELEDQARKVFTALLSADFRTAVYKESRDDWRKAEIVVSTAQSLLFNNKYQQLFSPTDFDLVVSDEAHRSIGGNARALFEFFVGYKLGLTATPKDYLRNFDPARRAARDPREAERRLLLDTYRTFGCEGGLATFRYSLIDGVREGFLIHPTIIDARTGVTTELLSDQGFVVSFTDAAGEDREESYKQREFEKRFFSEATNQLFCRVFFENALRDPVSGEVGKSIIFAVSQEHAAKLTQILNEMANRVFPGKYQSDFAVQVTSHVADAQQFAANFANNNLLGSGNFLPAYRTSKARVCVTVGMMTTGYDCPDVMNVGLFRPIFSPTEFVQIKGRGTRRHNFLEQLRDEQLKDGVAHPEKTAFKLFDFFANCEYFESGFNYDAVLELPRLSGDDAGDGGVRSRFGYEHLGADILASMQVETVGLQGMRIDRMLFDRFEGAVRDDRYVSDAVARGDWERAVEYVRREVLDRPHEYYTLETLRRAAGVDRRLTLREMLEKIFGLIPRFKSKDELLEEEFAKFVADHKPEEAESIPAMKTFFKAYVTSDQVRHIIESRDYADLATNPFLTLRDFREVPEKYRTLIPSYVKDYVSLNQFAT